MKKLTKKEYLLLGSMLFGMFFGAGNLIFPVYMGQLSGANSIPAIIGFCMTGVGLPLLGIAAIGISKSEGLFDASKKVSTWFSYFFTVILYLSIGPLFAIPLRQYNQQMVIYHNHSLQVFWKAITRWMP